MSVIFTDSSEWNPVIDDESGRRMYAFRATFGAHFPDPKFLPNADAVEGMYERGEIDGALIYFVPLVSATAAEMFAFLRRLIGPKPPEWLIGVYQDWESWAGTPYAQGGDHSRVANQLYGMIAGWFGSWNASGGYGNRGDLAELIPGRDRRMWVLEAKYGPDVTLDVNGSIGVQYTDGTDRWARPRGSDGKLLPTSTPPFGRCDHNYLPGFRNAKALRAWMRPTAPKHAAPTGPTKPSSPGKPSAPFYGRPSARSNGVVSPDGNTVLFVNNDGRVLVHHRGKPARNL